MSDIEDNDPLINVSNDPNYVDNPDHENDICSELICRLSILVLILMLISFISSGAFFIIKSMRYF